VTCSGPSFGLAVSTPQLSLAIPCLFTITLPSFSFNIRISLPSISIAFFLKLFFNLSICDLSLAFGLGAGVGLSAGACVPDPGLAEQTYAVVA
jgi:hypothetical protein